MMAITELKVECRMKVLSSVQRTGVLRVTSALKTTSRSTILIISGVMFIGLLTSERRGSKCRWRPKANHITLEREMEH